MYSNLRGGGDLGDEADVENPPSECHRSNTDKHCNPYTPSHKIKLERDKLEHPRVANIYANSITMSNDKVSHFPFLGMWWGRLCSPLLEPLEPI